jgi:hemerythrin
MKIKFITWEKEYSVDVLEIDTQHKELMTLINNSINNCTGNSIKEREYFDKAIDMEINFMTEHFKTEEKILEKTQYEKYEEHKKEHEVFLKKIKKLAEEVKEGKKELNLFDLTLYIKEWLLSHILLYDKGAKEYFKEGHKSQTL